jgi:hypothetical protein
MRGVLNAIRFLDGSVLNKELEESLENNTYFAPMYDTVLFILSDMIPITA